MSEDQLDTKTFWQQHQNLWPEFDSLAKMILSIPATSAPVERLFSVDGAILRPPRLRLFQLLRFLKCNLLLFKSIMTQSRK